MLSSIVKNFQDRNILSERLLFYAPFEELQDLILFMVSYSFISIVFEKGLRSPPRDFEFYITVRGKCVYAFSICGFSDSFWYSVSV